MTGTAALLYFVAEITRASGQLGIPPPEVTPILVEQRHAQAPANVTAYVRPCATKCEPGQVDVVWWLLWTGDKKRMQCVARHEAVHVALGHHRWSRMTSEEKEAQVASVMLARWKWPHGAACEAPPKPSK